MIPTREEVEAAVARHTGTAGPRWNEVVLDADAALRAELAAVTAERDRLRLAVEEAISYHEDLARRNWAVDFHEGRANAYRKALNGT